MTVTLMRVGMLAGIMLFASPALADTLTARVDSTQQGLATVSLNLSTHSPTSVSGLAGLIYWHRTDTQGEGVYTNDTNVGGIAQDFQTYCIELFQDVYLGGGPYTYNVVDLQQAPNPGTPVGQLNAAKALGLQWLWSLYHPAMLVSANTHAAFQLAIWEIVFDDSQKVSNSPVPSYDLTSGDLTVSSVSSGIYATAQSYLQGVKNHVWTGNETLPTLRAISSTTTQDQVLAVSFQPSFGELVVTGPVPAAAGMVPVILGVWATARRHRKTRS